MNLRVARCAVLVAHGRLVVEAWCAGRVNLTRLQRDIAVAFQTELIHIAALQHFCITGPVRRVAYGAAFNLGGRVLENERPLFVGMALHASGVRSGIEPRLLRFESAVRVMAIAALHCAFKDSVMERLRELPLHLIVTSQAELRLVLYQHFWWRQIVRVRREGTYRY